MANTAIQDFDGTPTTDVITQSVNIVDTYLVGGQNPFDNTTDKWPLAIATLFITGVSSAPTGPVDLYCMKGDVGAGTENEDAGGTTYAEGLVNSDAETQTAGLHYLGSFIFDDGDTGPQRQAITISLIGIKEAYFYIKNNTNFTLTQPVTLDIEGFSYTPSA